MFVALFQIYTILIINSHPFSFGVVFFPLFSWFSFLLLFDTIYSFDRLFIDSSHVDYDFISTLHNFDASFAYKYSIFLNIILFISVFPSHFRHANSFIVINSSIHFRMLNVFIAYIIFDQSFFFKEKEEEKTISNKREIIFHIFTIENNNSMKMYSKFRTKIF